MKWLESSFSLVAEDGPFPEHRLGGFLSWFWYEQAGVQVVCQKIQCWMHHLPLLHGVTCL